MDLLFSLALALVGPLQSALTQLRRRIALAHGSLPVKAAFEPTHWGAWHGVVAFLPDKRPEFFDSEPFKCPGSWLKHGAFLSETDFLLTIENTSTENFSRSVVITEIIANIERLPGRDSEERAQQVLFRWVPLAVGGDWMEIDDPEHPRILPRVVHVREVPNKPVPLMYSMEGYVPPPGGYRLRAGSRFVFVFRFNFDVPGEYRVRLRLAASESGKEREPELISGLRLLQLGSLDELPGEVVTLEAGPVAGRPDPQQVADLLPHLALARERVQRAVSPPSPTSPYPVVVVRYDNSRPAPPGDYA